MLCLHYGCAVAEIVFFMKILIVEDSATLRHVLCAHISSAGHEPVVAVDGETALQILDQTEVDMVIMDVEMPGLDGFETTRLIREWLGDRWIPIIFVTGKNEEDDFREGIDAGGDDYLIKPVSETILIAKIRAMERIVEMRNQLNKLNEELTELSERDFLTKLYNRRTFEERAEEHWRKAARTKEPLSILLLDIDHFKAYNDFYGHIQGDQCIQKVASAIQNCLGRPGDIVARYGGEEFIMLLPNTREDGAHHVAERIRQAVVDLDIPHRESSTATHITVSIGGAVAAHTSGTRILDQINAADKALYSSKQNGRDKVTVKLFSPKTLILVAQYGQSIVKAIDGKLQNHCAVLHARSAEETVLLATSNRPDVIIMDQDLSEGRGQEAARVIRNQLSSTHIPMIFCGDSGRKGLEDIIDDELDTVLAPPLEPMALANQLNELLFTQ